MKKLITITTILLITTSVSFAEMCQPKTDFSNSNPCPKTKKDKFEKTKNYSDAVKANMSAESTKNEDRSVRRSIDNYSGPSKALSKDGGESSSYRK